ncbi:hypothetical protein CGRA01v4_11120 [Colletotrichum graminicola]|uniref:Secreted protein n=1 Tax=Colletotrichum graminicola (strain M1.001 / M2 / FGSC 10212) TaxID=645133 RepID=E3QN21_COLGM|nr:uncharacterized protein GLRG_07403 [Colletotrichum graminicola M1.001]EFQ32259.1 hypothetical protein GLRG_07403 [Colletotrichum graminicola M1.001]WDK19832.1 hypothetical protein CGRA01v4_11120 [Colletotrichum graminicola]
MLVKLYSVLLALVALAAAGPSVLFAYWSQQTTQIRTCPDGYAINAREGRFWLGEHMPTTYCPDFSGANCPAGNTTVVDSLFRKLRISKPGGQRVYADPDGIISYTPGGNSSVEATPPGSNLDAFRELPVMPFVYGEDDRLLWFYKFGVDPNHSNIYACPDKKRDGMAYLRARWTSKENAVWDSQCFPLDGLLVHPSDDLIGAYEYTVA